MEKPAKPPANAEAPIQYLSPLRLITAAITHATLSEEGIDAPRFGKTLHPRLPLDLRPAMDLTPHRSAWCAESLPDCTRRQIYESSGAVRTPEEVLSGLLDNCCKAIVLWLLRLAWDMRITSVVDAAGNTRGTDTHKMIEERDTVIFPWTVRRTTTDCRIGNGRDGYDTLFIEPVPTALFHQIMEQPATKRAAMVKREIKSVFTRVQFGLESTKDTRGIILFVNRDNCDIMEVPILRDRQAMAAMKRRCEKIMEQMTSGKLPKPEHTPGAHPECDLCMGRDECCCSSPDE